MLCNLIALMAGIFLVPGQVMVYSTDDRGEGPLAEAVYYMLSDEVWLSIDRVYRESMTARACFVVDGRQACSVVSMLETLDVQPEVDIESRDGEIEVHVYFYQNGIEAKQLHYIHGHVIDGLEAYLCEHNPALCRE